MIEKRLFGEETTVTGPSAESSSIPKRTVETFDNHVYFYAEVNPDRCLALIQNIRELDGRLRNERTSRSLPEGYPPTPIWLHIHSYGGAIFAGFGVADQLATISSPVFSVIEGVCASAATLISMSCTKRYIMPSAFVLIHQLSGFSWGTYEQMKGDMKMQDMAMEALASFYQERSQLGMEEVQEMLKHESWFSAKQALGKGLVDEIG